MIAGEIEELAALGIDANESNIPRPRFRSVEERAYSRIQYGLEWDS